MSECDALKQENEVLRFNCRQMKADADLQPVHNARGAGRKPKASADDVALILEMRSQGNGATKIFKAFNGRISERTIRRIVQNSPRQN